MFWISRAKISTLATLGLCADLFVATSFSLAGVYCLGKRNGRVFPMRVLVLVTHLVFQSGPEVTKMGFPPPDGKSPSSELIKVDIFVESNISTDLRLGA